MPNDICRIPVVGHMTKGADGHYHLDEASSTWADIPADAIAHFLVERCGTDAIFGEEASAIAQ